MTLAKRVASATTKLSLSQGLVRALSILTMPILTRLLVPEAYGLAAIVGTTVSLGAMIALAGIDASYARMWHPGGGYASDDVEAFAWRYAIIAGLIVALGAAVVWAQLVAEMIAMPRYLGVFIGISTFACVLFAMAQTRARLNNQFGKMSIVALMAGFGAAAISIGIATFWRQDELALILAALATYAIPVVGLGIPALGSLLRSVNLGISDKIKILKVGLAAIVTAPMYWVLSSLDRWFLGYFEDASSVGIYSVGYSVAVIGMVVNTAIGSVWLTEAVKEYNSSDDEGRAVLGDLAEKLIIALALVWLAIAAAGGDVVRLLAASSFHSAAELVPFIAAAVFFNGVLLLGNAGLMLRKKLHESIVWWLGGAVLCLVLNVWLIPKFGRIGAAATQSLTFAFVAVGILYSSQRHFAMPIRKFRTSTIALVILLIGMIMHPGWSASALLSIVMKFPLGVLVVFAVVKITMPEILEKLWASLRAGGN